MPSVKRPRRNNWKVVVIVEISDAKPRWYGPKGARFRGQPLTRRHSFAGRTAENAWRLFWHYHGAPNVIGGPELWQGKRLMMGLSISSPEDIISRLTNTPGL